MFIVFLVEQQKLKKKKLYQTNLSPMNFHFNLLIQYENMVALFKANAQTKVEDLEDLVYLKRPQLIGHKFNMKTWLHFSRSS